MAKYGSPSAVFLVDGYNFLSAKLKSLSLKITSIQEQSDGLGDTSEAFTPVGKQQASLTQGGGFFDTATAGLHAAMAAGLPTTPQATVRVACVGCMGQAVGAVAWGIQGIFSVAYELLLELTKLSKANVAYVMAGLIEPGLIIQPTASKTVDWNTKTLATPVDYTTDPGQRTIAITAASKAAACIVTTAVEHGYSAGQKVLISGNSLSGPSINADLAVTVLTPTTFSVPVNTTGSSGAGTGGTIVKSNSINGAAGYQQISAFSGFTGFVGKLRDSPDDVTYTDLITFSNVTTYPVAERVTVAGTVDRYMSFDGNVTGSGSIDAFSMLARL